MPTVIELKAECKKRGLKGYSKLNKNELIKILEKKPEPKKKQVVKKKPEPKKKFPPVPKHKIVLKKKLPQFPQVPKHKIVLKKKLPQFPPVPTHKIVLKKK